MKKRKTISHMKGDTIMTVKKVLGIVILYDIGKRALVKGLHKAATTIPCKIYKHFTDGEEEIEWNGEEFVLVNEENEEES